MQEAQESKPRPPSRQYAHVASKFRETAPSVARQSGEVGRPASRQPAARPSSAASTASRPTTSASTGSSRPATSASDG
jgi:hypothetical protein